MRNDLIMKTSDITLFRPDTRQTFSIGGRLVIGEDETDLIVESIRTFFSFVWITAGNKTGKVRFFFHSIPYIKTSYADIQPKR